MAQLRPCDDCGGQWNLVAMKRDWIPEWLYRLLLLAFGRTLPTKSPLRQLLFRERRGRPQQ